MSIDGIIILTKLERKQYEDAEKFRVILMICTEFQTHVYRCTTDIIQIRSHYFDIHIIQMEWHYFQISIAYRCCVDLRTLVGGAKMPFCSVLHLTKSKISSESTSQPMYDCCWIFMIGAKPRTSMRLWSRSFCAASWQDALIFTLSFRTISNCYTSRTYADCQTRLWAIYQHGSGIRASARSMMPLRIPRFPNEGPERKKRSHPWSNIFSSLRTRERA